MFTTNVFSGRTGRRVHYGYMLDVFKALAPVGGTATLHCEDDDLVVHAYEKHIAAGDTHFTKMPDVHTDLSEELAIRQVLRLGEAAGCRLYIMHVSCELGVRAIREARAAGQDVHGETLHQYALFSRDHYHRQNGQIYHTYPSLKEAHDCAALWQGLADGTLSTVATDGVVTTFEQKMMGDRIDDVTGGSAGIEERMAVTYSGGLNRGLSLTQLAEVTSTNAARLLGMYPQKGATFRERRGPGRPRVASADAPAFAGSPPDRLQPLGRHRGAAVAHHDDAPRHRRRRRRKAACRLARRPPSQAHTTDRLTPRVVYIRTAGLGGDEEARVAQVFSVTNVVQLRTLVAVVRHGSFSGAARDLGYSPSAVSQQIAALEARARSGSSSVVRTASIPRPWPARSRSG